eukprot:TRINITY_DN37492_c0_g1_i1.p1 TRINITY_DN37492_c0_g1~~TRINITY_DN37492_c0_g1_i1.p1  ORF type:complete len:201 (+),score=31.64 TRINITY_DN37492_c0_g1_i1:62-664(+)
MPTAAMVVQAFEEAYEPQKPPYPTLTLALRPGGTCPEGYDMVDGHKQYRIDCMVNIQDEDAPAPSFQASWRAHRRLFKIQTLHALLLYQMGRPKYECLFHPDAHFVHRTNRVPGTTNRLAIWLDRLADVISKGKVPQVVMKGVLLFFVQDSYFKHELDKLRITPWSEEKRLDADENFTHVRMWEAMPQAPLQPETNEVED